MRLACSRTFRPWHWTLTAYPGVNRVTTTLYVWGWWSLEL